MKKFFYSFLIFIILLIVTIVVAANSSYVIKKVADIFAPDYNISYDDITGNVFTGVNIAGLKFDNKEITKNIKFSWNPSKILYKRVAINEISGEDLDVDVVKELIASFPKSVEDNSSSGPLPVVITVDKVHLTVKPFEEQGIAFHKTEVDVKDVSYASDEIEVGSLFVHLDTNLTKLVLYASLEDGKLTISELGVEEIDSEMIESLLLAKKSHESDENNISEEKTADKDVSREKEEMNPLIPKEVFIENFLATLKPRSYKEATIDKLQIDIHKADVNLEKVLANKSAAIAVAKYNFNFQSDVGQITLSGDLKNDTVTLDDINLTKIDTLALKAMFVPDSNESNVSDANATLAENNTASKAVLAENKSTKPKEENNLIPKFVIVKSLHSDVLPSAYDPVSITLLDLDVKDVKFDVKKLLVEKGKIDLVGKTNFSNIEQHSDIKNNKLLGEIVITPRKELFDFYKVPVRQKAIGDIKIDLNATEEKVWVTVRAKAKQLLIVNNDTDNSDMNVTESNTTDGNKTKPFNVDIDMLRSNIVYGIKTNTLEAHTKIMVSTPYAKDIALKNTFVMDESMHYEGTINADKVIGLDAKMVSALKHFNITYKGNLESIDTQLSSEGLKGSFVSKDMKKAHFHLESTEAIEVGKIVALPAELNATKVSLFVDVPLDLSKLTSIKGKAKITSNVANIDADIFYGKELKIVATTVIPKDSLLINFDKNIHFSAISPMVTTFQSDDKEVKLSSKSSKIFANIAIKPYDKKAKGIIKLAGLTAKLDTEANGDLVITNDVDSFATLLHTIEQFYTLENMPKIDGKLNMSMRINQNEEARLTLSSPEIVYHADRKTNHDIDDVKIVLLKKGNKILLDSYTLSYNKMKFFATKPSEVNFKKNNLVINQLWLNDQLKVTGQLDTKTMKGQILADAPTFHLAHEMIDLDSAINIETVLDGNSTDIKGKVTLLGGDVHYDLAKKTFPSDSDIVIVQEMKKKEGSPFMDNLTIALNIDTKKPLVFKQGPINVQSKVQMGIHKAIYSDPMVIGSVDLVDGGYYIFQRKKFVLENSHVYFTGDPNKPMLDITVKYKTIKSSLITINITGTPAVPNILFSSVPSMTKEQILSIILFDSEEGAGTNSGDDMMKMMGGAMAKSALSNLGVKLDHLVIGEGNSVEVGKKISDKVTVIYINGDIPEMKVKYDYSPSLEGVIGASERSESADIVYKKDFSADDIVIMGR